VRKARGHAFPHGAIWDASLDDRNRGDEFDRGQNTDAQAETQSTPNPTLNQSGQEIRVENEKRRQKEARVNTVTSKDGTTIAYDKSGEGPALILVGPALSNRSADGPFAELLAPHFTVIAYDRRGRGESGDTQPYAVEREIEDIDALIKAVGGSAYAFGQSSGGVLAMEAAAHGLAITKLAMFEPPFGVDESRPPLPENYITHLTDLIASGRRGDAVEYFMSKAVGVPAEMLSGMRHMPMWPDLEAAAPTLLYDQAVMDASMQGSSLRSDVLGAVKALTLVMDGGASPMWLRNPVQAATDAIPNARRRTLEGQTHGIMMEAPHILAQALIEYFNG
jgi:pimeloyl-ACP methyl ester carboxylesterase